MISFNSFIIIKIPFNYALSPEGIDQLQQSENISFQGGSKVTDQLQVEENSRESDSARKLIFQVWFSVISGFNFNILYYIIE